MNFIFGACYIVMKLLVNSLSLEFGKGSNETNLTICEFFHSVFNLECSFTKALVYNDGEEQEFIRTILTEGKSAPKKP
jgi:hypothetical protein